MNRILSVFLALVVCLGGSANASAQCGTCSGPQKVKIALRLSARFAGKVTTTISVGGVALTPIVMTAGSITYNSSAGRYEVASYGNGEWANTQMVEVTLDDKVSQEILFTSVWEDDATKAAFTAFDPWQPDLYQGLNFPSAGCLSYWLDPGSGQYARFEFSTLSQPIEGARLASRLQVKLGDGISTEPSGASSGLVAGTMGPFPPRADYLDTHLIKSRFGAGTAMKGAPAVASDPPSRFVPPQKLPLDSREPMRAAEPGITRAVFRVDPSLAPKRSVVSGPIQEGAGAVEGPSMIAAAKAAVAAGSPVGAAPPATVAGAPIGALYLPLSLGGDQGRLFFSAAAISAAVYSPTHLSLSSEDRVVQRVTTTGGVLRQLLLLDAFLDIRTIAADSFEVRFYSPTQIGGFDAGLGLFPITNDAPSAVWQIDNPDVLPTANRVRFRETRDGTTGTHLASWTPPAGANRGIMTLSFNGGEVVETREYFLGTSVDANIRKQRIVRRGPGVDGPIASDTLETWKEFYNWGQSGQVFEAVTERVEDPDGNALTTTYVYFDKPGVSAGLLNAVIHPDGYWEVYTRFSTGEAGETYRPYGDTPASPLPGVNAPDCRFTRVTYDDESYGPGVQLRLEETFVLGAPVGRTLLWKQLDSENGLIFETTCRYLDESRFTQSQRVIHSIHAPADEEVDEAGASLRRRTQLGWWNPQTRTFSQARSSTLPKAKRTFTVHGSSAHPNGLANRTLIEVAIEDEHGHSLCEEQYVNTDGAALNPAAWARTDAIDRSVRTYDARGLLTGIERNGLVVYEAGYFADGKLDWEIDEAGVRTAYTYDGFGRVGTKVRTLAATDPVQTTTFTYDAAGRLRFETLSATKAGVTQTLTTEYRYDLAGRMTHSISPEGLTTQTAEEMVLDGEGQPLAKRLTTTAPSGATTTTEYYRDRRPWEITGTEVASTYFSHYLTETPAGYFEFTQTFRDPALTDFRNETLLDWLGHTVQSTVPGFHGVGYVSRRTTYDGGPGADGSVRGLLSRVAEPGRSASLFEYDEFGVQTAAGLDADGNGVLDRAGIDPVTLSNLVYERANGTSPWFVLAQQSKLFTNASATATLVGESRQQLTGLATGVVSQREVLGNDGRRIAEKRSVVRATKTSIIELRDTAAAPAAGATTETTIAGLVRTLRRAGASADVSYSYDSLGRSETVTDPLNGSLTSVYNAAGQLQSVTDSAATPRTTRYTYYGDGEAGAGQVATVTDAADVVTRIAYTATGQRYRQWGSGVLPTQSTYDDEGRLTELRTFRTQDTQNGGAVDWSQESWPANAPAGDLTQWGYDAPSGLLEFKRAADYNAADTSPIQQSYSYDAALRLRVRTNARGQTATYGYDGLGQMTTIAYSAGSGAANASLGYDRAGRLSSATDGTGARTFTLTPFGQPDDDSYTAGLLAGLTVNRSFDANRRPSGVAVAGAVAMAFGYDDYSRLSTITDTREAAALLFTYGYTAGTGRVETVEARRAAALRLTAKRTFDTLGRLSGTETRNASNQVLVSHGYTGFDALDRRTTVDREDGKRWDYGYDARGEVISAAKRFPDGEGGQALAGWSASYLYDSIGNRIATSDFTATLPNAGSSLRADYTPNAVNEYELRTVPARLSLTGDAAAAAVVAVAVNEAPLTVTRQGAAGAQAFWAADWLPPNATTPAFGQVRVQATVAGRAPAGSVGALFLQKSPEVFSHDRDGNLTQDGRWNYTWDAENRLITMETRPELMQPVGVLPVEQRTKLEFAYDFTGRRIRKQVSTWNLSLGTWTLERDQRFLYDGWNLLAEFSVQGSVFSVQHSYVWGLDLSGSFQGAGGVGGLLAIHQPAGAVHLPAFDGNGNLAAAFDAGTLSEVARFDYDAFGRTLQAVGSAVAAIPFRFSTKYTDSETGLLYYGFRYYNTSTGRWLSRDPLEEEGGANLYGFVGNSSLGRVDRLGLDWLNDTSDFLDTGFNAMNPNSNLRRTLRSTLNQGSSWMSLVMGNSDVALEFEQAAQSDTLRDIWVDGGYDRDAVDAAFSGADIGSSCWTSCMKDLNKQLGALLAAAAAASPGAPIVPKSWLPKWISRGAVSQGPGHSTVSTPIRTAAVAATKKLGVDHPITKALHKYATASKTAPYRTAARGGLLAAVTAEAGFSLYCAKKCCEDPKP